MWQYMIVGILLVAAVIYVVRTVVRTSKGEACESGKCCDKKSMHKG
jgi:hypothetical protein